MEMAELIEDRSVNAYIYGQLKRIKKTNVDTKDILNALGKIISNEYSFNYTPDGMVIKVDRKKNILEIKDRIISILKTLVPIDIDIKFLFKILSNNSEISLRTKRSM